MEAVREHTAEGPFGTLPYARHRPEETLLYQVIDDHYVDFIAQLDAQGRTLPKFVRREFEDYLKCGRLDRGHRTRWTPRTPRSIGYLTHRLNTRIGTCATIPGSRWLILRIR